MPLIPLKNHHESGTIVEPCKGMIPITLNRHAFQNTKITTVGSFVGMLTHSPHSCSVCWQDYNTYEKNQYDWLDAQIQIKQG